MSNWADILTVFTPEEGPAVLVTVGAIKGSTPRDTGANMLVTTKRTAGTIGGGRLEYLAIEKARAMLSDYSADAQILKLPLGPDLAQCCGGHVDILMDKLEADEVLNLFNRLNILNDFGVLLSHWSKKGCRRQLAGISDCPIYIDKPLQSAIERRIVAPGAEIVFSPTDKASFTLVQSLNNAEFHITLFGAGHVGKALVHVLSPLPCSIIWVDQREDTFPDHIPSNVRKIVTDSPADQVAGSLANSFFLVMTHSHQLDLEICETLLNQRSDEAYIGVIGSKTKKAKFEKRLALRGFDAGTIARITCPIGLDHLNGKRPAEIALSVATDILLRHRRAVERKASTKVEGANGI